MHTRPGGDEKESEVNQKDLEVQGCCLEKMCSASRIHRLGDEKLGKVEMGRWNVVKKEGENRNRQRIGKVK